jgi:CBS domain containing-hemolysin-like protein
MGMEWVIQCGAIGLSFLLAAVLSLRYDPNGLSEFELQRQVNAGEEAAKAEQARRVLLPIYIALRSFKEIVITVGLGILLLATQPVWLGGLLLIVYIFAARMVAAQGWLSPWLWRLQMTTERNHQKHVQKIAPFVGWLTPKKVFANDAGVASRDELRQLIATDSTLLAPDDKARLLGAFDFGTLTVADAMVARDDIATVDIKETVGPVLLDRLHKANHRIFVVVKKDVDHIKGLLYMHDLTPLHPDLKDVKDAVRPTVHYLPVKASLQDVLAASLLTGRQLFIIVDKDGTTKGLITLADALRYLCGEPLPSAAPVSTGPNITTEE